MFLINVDGEIIANDKNHYAQNWACRSISNFVEDTLYNYDKYQHSVHGNLILDKNIRAVPYAVYTTDKGICTKSTGEISLYTAERALSKGLLYCTVVMEF